LHSERKFIAGLVAAGALAISPLLLAAGPGAVVDRTHMSSERGDAGRAGISAFRHERAFDEAQLLRSLFSGLRSTRSGSSGTVHRSPGARAHRRWAHGRASGLVGASRS
jgi:hypothetical protein